MMKGLVKAANSITYIEEDERLEPKFERGWLFHWIELNCSLKSFPKTCRCLLEEAGTRDNCIANSGFLGSFGGPIATYKSLFENRVVNYVDWGQLLRPTDQEHQPSDGNGLRAMMAEKNMVFFDYRLAPEDVGEEKHHHHTTSYCNR